MISTPFFANIYILNLLLYHNKLQMYIFFCIFLVRYGISFIKRARMRKKRVEKPQNQVYNL